MVQWVIEYESDTNVTADVFVMVDGEREFRSGTIAAGHPWRCQQVADKVFADVCAHGHPTVFTATVEYAGDVIGEERVELMKPAQVVYAKAWFTRTGEPTAAIGRETRDMTMPWDAGGAP